MKPTQKKKVFQELQEPEGGLRRQMIVGSIALVGLAPILAAYFISLWSEPVFRLFPLAMACSLFLYWRAWHESRRPPVSGSKWISLLGTPVVLFLLSAAVFKSRAALGYSASLLGISLFLWSVGGRVLFRESFPALLLALFCTIPALHFLQENLAGNCENSLKIASIGLGLLGIPNAADVDSLRLPGAQIMHIQPTLIAGVLFSSVVLAAFYSFVRRRPFISFPMVVIATWFSAPFAIGLILMLCGSSTYYGKIPASTWNTPWISVAMWFGIFIVGTWLPDLLLQRRYTIPLIIRKTNKENTEPLMEWIRLGVTIKLISAVLVTLGIIQMFFIVKTLISRHRAAQVSTILSSHHLAVAGNDLSSSTPTCGKVFRR